MPELISPTDIIEKSWDNLRKHYRSYSEFVVIFVLISILQWTLTVVLRSVVDDKILRLTTNIIASVPAIIMYAVLGGAMIDFTVKALQKKKVDVRESMHVGFHLMLSLIWVTLLTTLAVIFGLIFLILPAILFYIWFKFAHYHVVVDGIKGTGALRASKALMDGRWWAVLWRLVVPIVFFTMASAFVTAIINLVVGAVLGDPRLFFGNVADYDQLSNTHTLVMAVVPQTVDSFAFALFLGADIALWLDLRKRI